VLGTVASEFDEAPESEPDAVDAPASAEGGGGGLFAIAPEDPVPPPPDEVDELPELPPEVAPAPELGEGDSPVFDESPPHAAMIIATPKHDTALSNKSTGVAPVRGGKRNL
jgi:hypothetical protein